MKRLDFLWNDHVILTLLALAQTIGFTYASLLAETSTNPVTVGLIAARGILLGAAVSFGTAITAQRAPRIQSKRARELAFIGLGGLLVVAPLVMAPVIMAAMSAELKGVLHPVVQWIYAAVFAVVPDFVAVAVAAGSGKLAAETQNSDETSQLAKAKGKAAKDEAQTAEAVEEAAPALAQPAPIPALVCDRCGTSATKAGQPFTKPEQVSAHKKTCKGSASQPAEPVGYRVDFTPIQ